MNPPPVLPAEREGYPAPPDLAERRALMAKAIAAGGFKGEREPVETELAGLRTLRFAPDGPPRGVMLQLHGGGFRIGRPEFECKYSAKVAAECGIEVVVPQYRLAPENPFPAGLNDARMALEALRQETSGPLIVSGDSAGAGLAASLAVMASVPIDALVLLSPWLDLTVSAASYSANAASDPLFSTESAQTASDLYLQGFDPRHSLASPLFGPIDHFPPALISVGMGEVLLDDSRALHARLLAAGKSSRLIAIDGMEHVAVVRGMELAGAAETFAAVAGFIDRICAQWAAAL